MNITIVTKKKPNASQSSPQVRHTPPYTQRYGAWGRVEQTYSINNSADIYLTTGVFLKHVPVLSGEWVTPGDDYTSGARNLPPKDTQVFVFMPYGNYDGCVVLGSGFVDDESNQKAAFMDDNGKERIRRRVLPGNWKEEYHYATGTAEIVSPDDKTICKIDYGTEEEAKDAPEFHLSLFDQIKADVISEKSVSLSAFDDEVKIEHTKGDSAKITVFDTELIIKQGEVSLVTKKSTVEVDGDAVIKTSGKTTVEASGDASVKGANVTVEAASNLTLKTGDAASWMPNILPVCPLGPMHGGASAGVVKLKGA